MVNIWNAEPEMTFCEGGVESEWIPTSGQQTKTQGFPFAVRMFITDSTNTNTRTSPPDLWRGSRWLRGGYARYLFKNEAHPSRYTLSQNVIPLLLGRKSKVTQGVILMGPVMRVDRLRRGGGWALARCCLQIGFQQVRHPHWWYPP